MLGHHGSADDHDCPDKPERFPAFKRDGKLSEYIGKEQLEKVSDGIFHRLRGLHSTGVQTVIDKLNERQECDGDFHNELLGVKRQEQGQFEVKVKCSGDEAVFYATFKSTSKRALVCTLSNNYPESSPRVNQF